MQAGEPPAVALVGLDPVPGPAGHQRGCDPAEAEVRENGQRLGAVGGRIVAEVFVGLAKKDPLSYLSVEPGWTPSLPTADGD